MKVSARAPMKALASEIVRKITKRLKWINITVKELTGGTYVTKFWAILIECHENRRHATHQNWDGWNSSHCYHTGKMGCRDTETERRGWTCQCMFCFTACDPCKLSKFTSIVAQAVNYWWSTSLERGKRSGDRNDRSSNTSPGQSNAWTTNLDIVLNKIN